MSPFHAKAAAGILAGLTLLVGSGCIPQPVPLPEPKQTTEEEEATDFSGFESLPTSSSYDFANGSGGSNAVRPPGSDVLADDMEDVKSYLRNHVADALQPSNTLSGLWYYETAIRAICDAGSIPESAVRQVKGDLLLTELLKQAKTVGCLLGVEDTDALVRAIAARLAPSADAAADPTATSATWITAKRAWNDEIAKALGVGDAARAVGGIRRLVEFVSILQILGQDIAPSDLRSSEWVRKLRNTSTDRIIAEAAAEGLGLPPSFANRHARDLLNDAATLQLIGFDGNLRDPGVQREIEKQGWRMFIRSQVLQSLGLPSNAGISASPAEIIRQASLVDLMGGDHSKPSNYAVVRDFDRGVLSLGGAIKKVNDNNNGGQNSNTNSRNNSNSNSTNPDSTAGPGSSPGDRPSSNPASTPATPSNSNSNTNTSGSSGTAPSGGQQSGGQSSNNNNNSSANSGGTDLPAGTPDSTPSGQSGDGLTFEVETQQTGDHTFVATEIWIAADGTRYEGASVEFSDGDGDGTYTAATDSNWGTYEGSMPADGSHAAERDDEGTTTFQVDQDDDSGQSSDSDAQEQAEASDSSSSGSMTQDQYYARQRLWLGFSNTLLLANARGNLLALALGDFRTGTGNSTPVPEGGSVGWISPAGDQDIPRWFFGDPYEADAARSGEIVPREDQSSHGGNVINPGPDAPGGSGAPYQIPTVMPNGGPGTSGHAPSPLR